MMQYIKKYHAIRPKTQEKSRHRLGHSLCTHHREHDFALYSITTAVDSRKIAKGPIQYRTCVVKRKSGHLEGFPDFFVPTVGM